MKRTWLLLTFIICIVASAFCQKYTISGRVLNGRTNEPVSFAAVSLPNNELWAISNEQGVFRIENINEGKTYITVYSLGYAKKMYEINVTHNISDWQILLPENDLALNEVEVTAQRGVELGTSYLIDRTALDHLQMLTITDAASLLPGGKTNRAQHLASGVQQFLVNGQSGENGNPSFGVAIEVDGVRLSNNSAFDTSVGSNRIQGTDIRNIASSNIESIEVVTGVPSVEYGDLSNGIVKINTKKGKTPYIIEMATKPNTKQIAVSKGFDLGRNKGILNTSIEHTKSTSNLASPYTAYDRNGLALNYSKTFNQANRRPIILDAGITGNIGGYDSKSDPDLFINTYTKSRDNVLRGNLSIKWLINKPWITNIEGSGSFNYNDKLSETSSNQSRSSSVASIRTAEQGYHVGEKYEDNPNADIVLIPPGYWYYISYWDSKIMNYSAKIKATLFKKTGNIGNSLIAGGEYSSNGNLGDGTTYKSKYIPTWREYKLSDQPYMNTYSAYVEDKVNIQLEKSTFELNAGIRSDITIIDGSEYGTINTFSPRFNAKYTFLKESGKMISNISLRLGWGKAVKLPSFVALYPIPSYTDILTFAAPTTSEGDSYYAYYTMPSSRIYNSDLKWQYNIQNSVGIDFDINGIKVSLTASQNKTYNPYIATSVYTPFSYKFTSQESLNNSLIPINDRAYSVDKNTGIVTVMDKTGTHASETLAYTNRDTFKGSAMYVNGSPTTRRQFNWIVDFGKIRSLNTSFRWDGNYYYYKGVEQTMIASSSALNMADGRPYRYIGFYVGGSASSNGDVSKELNSNVTVTTHIPAIKMIVSLRIESTLYNYSQNLSEYADGIRSYTIDSKNDFLPSDLSQDIYSSNMYTALYPSYYVSYDDMGTKIPFLEKLIWAKNNDQNLYNDLAKLVTKTNNTSFFKKSTLSAYFSSNISVTKEIGRFASISFNATNFINTMQQVHDNKWNTDYSLFNSSLIPSFYYGMSLRLKL